MHREQPTKRTQTLWQRLVEQLAGSTAADQRSALLLGSSPEQGVPTLLPREALVHGHLHVSGKIGAGKTASVLMPLALQFLNGYRDGHGQPAPPAPLVIFDLKGDSALFHAVRDTAERQGRTFRYFSLRPGDDYHFFDPFQLFRIGRQQTLSLATTFIRSLGLDYGMIYGGLYFTDQNTHLLLRGLRRLSELGEEPSLARLNRLITRLAGKSEHADARHIKVILEMLAEFPQVNREAHVRLPARRIDFEQVLEDAEVVYFFLELQSEATTQRQPPLFALFSLVNAALARRQRSLPPRECYVIIDEFYHIAGRSFGELLTAVRHAGLRFVLANQTRAQLLAHDANLPRIVRANAAAELLFDVSEEEDFRYLQQLSGRRKELMASYTHLASWPDLSMSEVWDWQLTLEAIHAYSARPQQAILVVRDQRTAALGPWVQPLETLFPLSRSAYAELEHRLFPRLAEVASYAVPERPAPPPEPHKPPPAARKFSKFAALLQTRYRALWEELDKLEGPFADSRKDKRP